MLRLLGAESVILTNASGAVNPEFDAGDITMITDHIKLFGVSPLYGANVEEFGPGPHYETPAEVRAAHILGADAVGMSTGLETIVAAHCGMKVLGFSLCTCMAAGVSDTPLDGDEVIAPGQRATLRFAALIKGCLERL